MRKQPRFNLVRCFDFFQPFHRVHVKVGSDDLVPHSVTTRENTWIPRVQERLFPMVSATEITEGERSFGSSLAHTAGISSFQSSP